MTVLQAISAADSAVLAAVHGECFPDEPWDTTAVGEVMAMPGAFGFLAVATGATVPSGFVIALALAEECEILALGVRPAARRRGIAGALLARLAAMTASGNRVLLLEVAEDNEAALALYARAGFARVGRRPAYYRRGDGSAVAALQLRHEAAKAANNR
jgi:ribosomal-protein-alanine N-acetyltransferase